jgi:hypothetical protein
VHPVGVCPEFAGPDRAARCCAVDLVPGARVEHGDVVPVGQVEPQVPGSVDVHGGPLGQALGLDHRIPLPEDGSVGCGDDGVVETGEGRHGAVHRDRRIARVIVDRNGDPRDERQRPIQH